MLDTGSRTHLREQRGIPPRKEGNCSGKLSLSLSLKLTVQCKENRTINRWHERHTYKLFKAFSPKISKSKPEDILRQSKRNLASCILGKIAKRTGIRDRNECRYACFLGQ